MKNLFKNQKFLFALGGAAAVIAGRKIITAKKTRELAVSGLAKGMKLTHDAKEALPIYSAVQFCIAGVRIIWRNISRNLCVSAQCLYYGYLRKEYDKAYKRKSKLQKFLLKDDIIISAFIIFLLPCMSA